VERWTVTWKQGDVDSIQDQLLKYPVRAALEHGEMEVFVQDRLVNTFPDGLPTPPLL
jgi:hypothetical protein